MGSKKSGNRTGKPRAPGGGRSPKSATIKEGYPIRAARTHDGNYEFIGTGAATIERSGTDRIVRVLLEDGSMLVITVF